jgi:hypothetical protein
VVAACWCNDRIRVLGDEPHQRIKAGRGLQARRKSAGYIYYAGSRRRPVVIGVGRPLIMLL